jgi:hypothetical protein
MGSDVKQVVRAWIVTGTFAMLYAAAQPNATIEKPKTRTVTVGGCRILSGRHTFGHVGSERPADPGVHDWAGFDDGGPDARE